MWEFTWELKCLPADGAAACGTAAAAGRTRQATGGVGCWSSAACCSYCGPRRAAQGRTSGVAERRHRRAARQVRRGPSSRLQTQRRPLIRGTPAAPKRHNESLACLRSAAACMRAGGLKEKESESVKSICKL